MSNKEERQAEEAAAAAAAGQPDALDVEEDFSKPDIGGMVGGTSLASLEDDKEEEEEEEEKEEEKEREQTQKAEQEQQDQQRGRDADEELAYTEKMFSRLNMARQVIHDKENNKFTVTGEHEPQKPSACKAIEETAKNNFLTLTNGNIIKYKQCNATTGWKATPVHCNTFRCRNMKKEVKEDETQMEYFYRRLDYDYPLYKDVTHFPNIRTTLEEFKKETVNTLIYNQVVETVTKKQDKLEEEFELDKRKLEDSMSDGEKSERSNELKNRYNEKIVEPAVAAMEHLYERVFLPKPDQMYVCSHHEFAIPFMYALELSDNGTRDDLFVALEFIANRNKTRKDSDPELTSLLEELVNTAGELQDATLMAALDFNGMITNAYHLNEASPSSIGQKATELLGQLRQILEDNTSGRNRLVDMKFPGNDPAKENSTHKSQATFKGRRNGTRVVGTTTDERERKRAKTGSKRPRQAGSSQSPSLGGNVSPEE
jgi:hypothetical protein